MSSPNILKFSTFLAHQRPQDAQVRPLHRARVAGEEAQRPAAQPAAHVGLPGRAHRGRASAGPERGAIQIPARSNGRSVGTSRPQLPAGTRKN